MKATIKKIEELNQMAQDLKAMQDENSDLLSKALDATMKFHDRMGDRSWDTMNEVDERLLNLSIAAKDKLTKSNDDVKKLERKFNAGVRALATSLGLEIKKVKGGLNSHYYNKILDNIRIKMWATTQKWNEICEFSCFDILRVAEEMNINYKEVQL